MYKNLMEEVRACLLGRAKTLRIAKAVFSLALIAGLSYSLGGTQSGATPINSALTATTVSSGGYWMAGQDGSTYNFGTLGLGSAAPYHPVKPIVDMAATPDGHGYWLVASDGGVFSFGTAVYHGSMGGKKLNEPIVGMASTADGNGYWLVASDGGIFSFGDATFFGSMGGKKLNEPIVGMAATPDGNGYWLVASDGGIFSFGDATFYGSMGGKKLNEPIVGMGATGSGAGYWLVASDGGIFSFGDATFYGSMGGKKIPGPIVAIAADRTFNPFTPHSTGYDLSNYTKSIPPNLGTIAIAESDGYPFLDNRNPTIFKAEAAAAGSNLQLYTFLGAPFSAGKWYIAPNPSAYLSGPAGNCTTTNYICQATNYGWNEASHSLLNAKSLGISADIWWIDVETGGPWSTDLQINSAVIKGAIEYLHSQGALVGIYSTAHQWQLLTGGMILGSSTNPQPIWIAAPNYQQAACTNTALWFANGTPWLIQTGENYTYNAGLDYAC